MTEKQRMDWLEAGGIDRLSCARHIDKGAISYTYGVRLNIGSSTVKWRYTEFKTLRKAIDFGIKNPLVQ